MKRSWMNCLRRARISQAFGIFSGSVFSGGA
jgi:hypothetical protein